jgi:hypothetical protein
MWKWEALEKGILWICNQCEDYVKLDINSKINLKSEVAYYWNNRYDNNFQKHIQPVLQGFKEKSVNEFLFQEYLFSVGL